MSEAAKQAWLAKYKSREGKAIARRAWEECHRVKELETLRLWNALNIIAHMSSDEAEMQAREIAKEALK